MTRAAGLGLALLALLLSLASERTPLPSTVSSSPVALLLCLGGGLALAFLPGVSGAGRVLNRILFRSSRRAFNTGLFLTATASGTAVALLLFGGLPYLDDGVSSLFQARIFARGAVTLPLPPHAGFYELFCVIGEKAGTGRWSGMYPPGWPALLLPGVLLGVPWIVNPLLGGGLAVATAELGREIYGDFAGRLAGLLALTSPLMTVLAGTHLAHTASALFCALCLLAVLRLQRTGGTAWGVLAGAAWGAAFLCRPLDALLLGSLFALIPLSDWRSLSSRWRGIAAALAVAVVAAVTLAAFQKAVTGDPFTPGHKIGMQEYGRFGFIPLSAHKSHTPEKAVAHTLMRLRVVGERLIGWPIPLFLLALPAFLAGGFRARETILLLCPLVLAGTFAFYWYYEYFLPGRYLSSAAPELLVLGARGAAVVHEWASARGATVSRFTLSLFAASLLFSLLVVTPSEAREVRRRGGDIERTLPRVVEAYGIGNALVFMDSVSPGVQEEEKLNDFYGAGFLRNSLDLDGDIVYARNSREQNHLLASLHPARDYYLYRYQRDSRKAFLYRMTFKGREHCLVSVPPVESGLLLYDASRSASGGGPCLTEEQRAAR